ncbi:MAG TPA: glycosyltransferase [Flavobacteriia bacterium]|nr:glycosyltransferase [Flavobacteriia bacterium]
MKNKLLILSSVWLEPNSSAAGIRMLQLIDFFQQEKYQITYASTAQKSCYAEDVSKKGIKKQKIALNDPDFAFFLKKENPNMVLFDRFMVEEQFGWKVQETLPNAIRVLDTEDLHCLRKTRELAYNKNIPFTEELLLESDIAKREIASILRCDISLIISKFEMELLVNTFQVSQHILQYLPFLLNDAKINTAQKFKERNHFYFIGNNLHQPNVATVLLLKKIWKKIAVKLPNTQLHIYGAYPTNKIVQLHNEEERFFIKGRLNDINLLKTYRVLLAPIPFGAGLKGKFIEAMQNGTPSVTTKIGAEAMYDDLEWSGFICETDSDFIEKAILLFQNEISWKKAQDNGKVILGNLYQKESFLKNFKNKLKIISKDLKKHRKQNFIGQLLWYHTLKSTKYLAKWIEEKNKND